MKNKKIDIFKYLIPVVAVVIIIESVVVVSGLMKKDKGVKVDSSFVYEAMDQGEEVSAGVVEDEGTPKANFVFSVDSKDMKVGQSYQVDIDLLPKEDFSADAVDLFVSYDSEAFDVSRLVEGDDMPEAVSIRVSDKRNVILANFWFTEAEGYLFESAKPAHLLSFVVTPKKAGSTDFVVNRLGSQGEEINATRIVTTDKQTGQVLSLSFSSDELTVIISE